MHFYPTLVRTGFLSLVCCFAASAAHADTFHFAISTPAGEPYALSGSGTLSTSTGVNGAQYITSITGTVDNSANTGNAGNFAISLIPTSAPGAVTRVSYSAQDNSTFFFDYDNTLFPSATNPLDGYGLAFMADGVSYNIGYVGSQALYLGIRPNDIAFDQRTYQGVAINFDLTPAAAAVTPEPTSIALLGSGLLCMGGVLRRRSTR